MSRSNAYARTWKGPDSARSLKKILAGAGAGSLARVLQRIAGEVGAWRKHAQRGLKARANDAFANISRSSAMTTSKKVMKHPSHPAKGALNGASTARAKIIRRAPSAAAILRRAPSAGAIFRSTSPQVKAIGAAAIATGIAAGASVLMRKPLTKAVRRGVRAAVSAGDYLGKSTRNAGSSLLVTVGLRRRSFLSRMWPEMAALGGVVAAAGATMFLLEGFRSMETMTAPQKTPFRGEGPSVDRVSLDPTLVDPEEARHVDQ
jgi:hypothetical protein